MIYLGDKEVGIVVQGGGEPNFLPYLVTYIEQDDGTYEMRITDYVEGGEGERVLIGTQDIEGGDLTNLYILTEGEL